MNKRFQIKNKYFLKNCTFILWAIFCVSGIQDVSGQEVTATFDKIKREMVIENNTGKEIVLFHTNNTELIKIKDNQIVYANLTIAGDSNIDKEIKNCGLEFETTPGNATHISKNTKTKTIPQIKKAPDVMVCYVIEGQKISRKITTPVKTTGQTEAENIGLQLVNDDPRKELKGEPTKTEPQKTEPKKETKKIVINPFTDKINILITKCNTILQKHILNDRDRDNLTLLKNEVNLQKEQIEEYLKLLWEKKKDTKEKCEDCDILILSSEKLIDNIEKVKSKIINALRRVDESVVLNWKKEYRNTVLLNENVIANDIKTLSEISVDLEERSQHYLWGWIGIKNVKSQLETINKRYQKMIEASNTFIAQKKKEYEDENDQAAIEELMNEIPVEYKEIQHCKERIADIKVPYAMMLGTGILLFLFIFGIIFYLTSILKNRKIATQKNQLRKSDKGSLLIEEDDDMIQVISYKAGLSEVKAKAGIDFYEVNMLSMSDDTSIRTVYFSRKAILDIYKFFSGFLRYDDKTNETGCFLVGRWEYVPNSGEKMYDISIESLVEPGDDAVYGEYNLNFGAKIGITLTYALENLCEKTGNEYVHTVWMHSHPGLGLFLSSQDLNVQSQLAHSQHQGRMLAIVIDSNSPDFQMAFFAPKQSGQMNNDKDLKQTVPLETLYQWAKSLPKIEKAPPPPVQPPKISYYDMDIPHHTGKINKIHLSASTIIDIDAVIMPGTYGLQGHFYGTGQEKEIFINDFKEEVDIDKDKAMGCFLTNPNFSFPQTIHEYLQVITDFNFAVFYSFENKNLYILFKDEQGQYPETEDKIISAPLLTMKEWTRRKR